jgi:hypothetical protein
MRKWVTVHRMRRDSRGRVGEKKNLFGDDCSTRSSSISISGFAQKTAFFSRPRHPFTPITGRFSCRISPYAPKLYAKHRRSRSNATHTGRKTKAGVIICRKCNVVSTRRRPPTVGDRRTHDRSLCVRVNSNGRRPGVRCYLSCRRDGGL